MSLFLITFCLMALAVAGMAIGVIFGRAPIAGSCGGLNAVDGSGKCLACSRPCRKARRAQAGKVATIERHIEPGSIERPGTPDAEPLRRGRTSEVDPSSRT